MVHSGKFGDRNLLIVLGIAILILGSCKARFTNKYSVVEADDKGANIKRISLSPLDHSTYKYSFVSENEMSVVIEDNKIENEEKKELGLTYFITKDSVNNFQFRTTFDKIKISSKNRDEETVLDADNANTSTANQAEKILGVIKSLNFTNTLNSKGEIVNSTGSEGVSQRLLSVIGSQDDQTRAQIESKLKEMQTGFFQKNVDHYFQIFPDSTIKVGDSWIKNSLENSEWGLVVTTKYTVIEIDEDYVTVEAAGSLKNQQSELKVMGYLTTANLAGKQEGEYLIESKTGMIKKCTLISEINGELNVLGRSVPIAATIKVKIEGRKL